MKKISLWFGLLLGLVAFVSIITATFKNPDMTPTRLLLEYWYLYVCLWVSVVVVSFNVNH